MHKKGHYGAALLGYAPLGIVAVAVGMVVGEAVG
jgi:hypothetical protein